MLVARADDCTVSAKYHLKVKEIIKSLERTFKLTHEGDLSAYLGIDMNKNDNGTCALLQPCLMDRMRKALNLEQDRKACGTPAYETLTSVKDEDTFSEY